MSEKLLGSQADLKKIKMQTEETQLQSLTVLLHVCKLDSYLSVSLHLGQEFAQMALNLDHKGPPL